MQTVILPLLLLTLCALAVGYLYNRTFETALPVVMLGTMLLLYAFYALNLLHAGRIAVLAACVALPAAALWRMIRRRNGLAFIRREILSPQMALYLALIVLFYLLSRNKQVGIWDDLRLWGSLPKALHAYGTLQFGADASLYSFSQSYPPAIPLLHYFFVSFSPVFSEGALYFTRAWFGLVLLLPLTRNMTWRHWPGLLAAAFLLLFVPYYLTTNDPDYAYYYESLYVDAPAGLLCGYLCWQVTKDCYKDWFSTITFAITLAALTLTKDFGVLFGGLCLMGSLLYTRRAAQRGQLRPALIKTGVTAAALALAYLSWQVLLHIYHVINYNTVTATLPTLQALGASFSYLCSSLVSIDLSIAAISLSFGAYMLLLILGYALVYRKKETLKADLPFLLLRTIGYAGYFFAYVMMFRDDIAGGVFPSIARYMVAMLLCETYVFLMAWMKISRRETRFLHRPFHSLTRGGKAAAILLSAALLALSASTIQGFWKYDGGVYWDAEQAAALVEQTVDMPEGEVADVWLVIGGDAWENSLLHHRVYFDLVGTHARVKTYILEANITQSGRAYTPGAFSRELAAGGYDYVLLLYGDDALSEEFGSLFPELIPYETDFLLYKVTPTGDGSATLALAGMP